MTAMLRQSITYFPLRDGALQIFDVNHGQCALLTMPAFGRTAYLADQLDSVDVAVFVNERRHSLNWRSSSA